MDPQSKCGNQRQSQFIKRAVVALSGILVLLGMGASSGWGQTYRILHLFDSRDGLGPHSRLVLSGTTLYGTTGGQGGADLGEVFKINTDGTGFTVLKRFAGVAGGVAFPQDVLILAGNTLYGTTGQGGTPHPYGGTIFKIDTEGGDFTILKTLNADAEGSPPLLNLLEGGALYGTASSGGSAEYGTLFKANIDGSAFTVLKTFTGPDGIEPYGLVGSATVLYGTTELGGAYSKGTVFRVSTDGSGYAVLKHFTGLDAAYPAQSLVLSGDTLYGTTYGGGGCCGTIFSINIAGRGFNVIKAFDPTTDGYYLPYSDLLISGTTIYGTAEQDGPADGGTVFKLDTDGSGFTVLKAFGVPGTIGGPSDGTYPTAGLLLSGRTLYGTTLDGGLGYGVIFSLLLPATAPNLSCPPAVVLECTNGAAMATLNVGVSDSSGNPVVVVWAVDGTPYQTNNVPSGGVLTCTNLMFTADFSLGEHLITVSASNGETAPATCSTSVEVRDTMAPQILSISATPNVLWPPNHRMVPVTIEVEAIDNCGSTTAKIIAVNSNEPAKEGSDWLVTGDLSVDLRARRLGKGHGRIYTIWVQCDDAAGNSAVTSVTVSVPHDEGRR